MRVCIHQPDFIPWLGFFDRLVQSDVFIILDDVQFIRRGWQNRDKIKTTKGAEWLTLPVEKKSRYDQKIIDVVLQQEPSSWREKHIKTIKSAYGRAPYFSQIMPEIESIYHRPHKLLSEFNFDFIKYLCAKLCIDIDIYFSSELEANGKSSERLSNLTKAIGGSVYLTGLGSKDYLDEDIFLDAGIRVEWQNFIQPIYPQLHGEFIPGLSAIDALMNCGDLTSSLLQNRSI